MWFRPLPPHSLYEATAASDTVAAFRAWFGAAEMFEVVATEHHTIAHREHIGYRFPLRPTGRPTANT